MSRRFVSTLDVRTPEGITFSLPLAGPLSRFLAWMVDAVCIWVAMWACEKLMRVLGLISTDLASGLNMLLGSLIIPTGYAIVLEWYWRGQTIGKRLMGLRVMDEQGLRLQFSQVVVRNLLRVVDTLPLFYLVGGTACLASRRMQRIGDFTANTVVVRHGRPVVAEISQASSGKYNSLAAQRHLAARLRQSVTPAEAGVALQALLRREQMDPEARIELFAEIASHFKSIVPYPEETLEGISDEQYVRNVVEVLFEARKGA